MRTVAIIQARLNSTRLPGKVLRDIHGKPMLLHVLERVAKARLVDQIVVATVHGNSGGPIAGRCDEWGVGCYQDPGDENDVLGRMVKAAGIFEADLIVRVCADNPLICPACIDRLIERITREPSDYAGYQIAKGWPEGQNGTGFFAEVITRESLDRASREALGEYDRELVTAYLHSNPERFNCHFARMPKWYRDEKPVNANVDTEEDFERVTQIIGELTHAPADPLPQVED